MVPVNNIEEKTVVTGREGRAVETWVWDFDVKEENEKLALVTFEMFGNMGISGVESLIKEGAVA